MKPSGRIAADTNVVLSAAAGRAAGRIFRSARGLEAVTTEANYLEIEEYLPRMAEQYGLEMSDIAANLEALPLDIYPEIRYRSHLAKAAEYLKARDPTMLPWPPSPLSSKFPSGQMTRTSTKCL